MEQLADPIGWMGMGLVLLAYALVSFKKVTAQTPVYQCLNVAGGLSLLTNAWYHGAMPSVALNFVWIIIGMTTLTLSWGKIHGRQK